MNRYAAMFQRLRSDGRGAFIPFTVLGDPDASTSYDICRWMVDAGADALELGIPFSDPVADGPTIQLAVNRALTHGATVGSSLQIIYRLRQQYPELPMGILTYANLVLQPDLDHFYARVADSGADSVLIADVPSLEAEPFAQAAQRHGVQPVLIAPPNAGDAQLDVIAKISQGYTYVVTRYGVTGAKDQLHLHHSDLLARLRARHAAPCVMGFGISSRQAVREAITAGADGAISGSAMVQLIQDHLDDPAAMRQSLREKVVDLSDPGNLRFDATRL